MCHYLDVKIMISFIYTVLIFPKALLPWKIIYSHFFIAKSCTEAVTGNTSDE